MNFCLSPRTMIKSIGIFAVCILWMADNVSHALNHGELQKDARDIFADKLADQHFLRQMYMEEGITFNMSRADAGSGTISSAPIMTRNLNTNPKGDLVVGVFYYPWHADDFHNDEGYESKRYAVSPDCLFLTLVFSLFNPKVP